MRKIGALMSIMFFAIGFWVRLQYPDSLPGRGRAGRIAAGIEQIRSQADERPTTQTPQTESKPGMTSAQAAQLASDVFASLGQALPTQDIFFRSEQKSCSDQKSCSEQKSRSDRKSRSEQTVAAGKAPSVRSNSIRSGTVTAPTFGQPAVQSNPFVD